MAEPKIVDTRPTVLELEPGTYFWCKCGYSQKQPFCDGAHKGTEFTPTKFTVETKQKVAVCNCKYTSNPPFCDGTHKKLLTEKASLTTAASPSEPVTSAPVAKQQKTNSFTALLGRIFKKTPSQAASKR